jgi:dihydrofolate reductase
MRKVIAAINMTIDGYCDHTLVDADDELHYHYAELLRNAGLFCMEGLLTS